MTFTVDVFSDVICPWCFIGKRRLEKAMSALDRPHDIRVRWLPYQLNPQFPRHHPVASSIQKITASLRLREKLLERGISDRDESASGEALKKDLLRMQRQNNESLWAISKLLDLLNRLEPIRPFNDIPPDKP